MPFVLVLIGQGKHDVCCDAGWYVPFLHVTQVFRLLFKNVPKYTEINALVFRNHIN